MNDQERQIISDIFRRLEGAASQQRDPDAERFIADKMRTQPYAPYAMAQALYVQEEAMKSLNEQLEQLRAENERLQQGAGGSGGFLSSLFGGGARQQQPGVNEFGRGAQGGPGQPQAGPWGGQPQGGQGYQQGGYAPQQGGPWGGAQQQPQAAGGGGFLRGALTTAAGVAGGMVVGNALMNAFSGGHSALGNLSPTDVASMGGSDAGFAAGDSSGFSNAGFDNGGGFGSGDAGVQDASFDGGGDFGGDGGGDWT
jgi:hypothetical protein